MINATAAVPTGTVRVSLSEEEPPGWLALNGQAVSKSDYPGLFQIIGTSHGTTATTFNLPDMAGAGFSGAAGAGIGVLSGSSSLILTESQLPAHTHPIADPGHTHSLTDPGHTHSMDTATSSEVATGTGSFVSDPITSGTTGLAATGASIGINTTGISAGSTGNGAPIDIAPRRLGVTVLVKT